MSVRKPDDLVDDPHLNASGGLLDVVLPNGKPAKVLALPIMFGGVRAAPPRGIPSVGADTCSVLRAIDLNETEISELLQGNVIADKPKSPDGQPKGQAATLAAPQH